MKPEIIPEILFLKQEDVIKAGLLDMGMVLEETEKVFRAQGEGKVIQPPKLKLGMPDDDNWESFGNSMPAYINGEDEEVCGFKWAAESVHNPEMEGVPYGIDIVILSNPRTMFPKAILDGTITTAMRTSATAGVFAKYLAAKDSKIAALIGAGVIGRTMIMAIAASVPSLEELRIVDLDFAKAEALAAEFAEGGLYTVAPKVVPYGSTDKAIVNADVIVTETTARKPFIRAAQVKTNATCIQMEREAFDEACVLGADILAVDSYEQLLHHAGIIQTLDAEGKVTKEDAWELQDVVTGKVPGRTSDDQFVFCKTMGMGMVDIAIANKLYHQAKAMGLGTELTLWDMPLWV
ncbi:MAG: ornithine cyclodeaminase family protein [Mogibacterium sp.]|nr:ornithine cyclodeaminase family protein [Mogibacterium sp.]